MQLAVHQLQEVVLGPLIDGTDWPPPCSIEDLCDGPAALSVDLKPIGDLHYRLRRAVHADSFLAELAAVERRQRMRFVADNILHKQRPSTGRPGTIAVIASISLRAPPPCNTVADVGA